MATGHAGHGGGGGQVELTTAPCDLAVDAASSCVAPTAAELPAAGWRVTSDGADGEATEVNTWPSLLQLAIHTYVIPTLASSSSPTTATRSTRTSDTLRCEDPPPVLLILLLLLLPIVPLRAAATTTTVARLAACVTLDAAPSPSSKQGLIFAVTHINQTPYLQVNM